MPLLLLIKLWYFRVLSHWHKNRNLGRSLREAKLIRESPLIRWVACHGQPEEEEDDDSIGGTTGPMIKAVVMRDVCSPSQVPQPSPTEARWRGTSGSTWTPLRTVLVQPADILSLRSSRIKGRSDFKNISFQYQSNYFLNGLSLSKINWHLLHDVSVQKRRKEHWTSLFNISLQVVCVKQGPWCSLFKICFNTQTSDQQWLCKSWLWNYSAWPPPQYPLDTMPFRAESGSYVQIFFSWTTSSWLNP